MYVTQKYIKVDILPWKLIILNSFCPPKNYIPQEKQNQIVQYIVTCQSARDNQLAVFPTISKKSLMLQNMGFRRLSHSISAWQKILLTASLTNDYPTSAGKPSRKVSPSLPKAASANFFLTSNWPSTWKPKHDGVIQWNSTNLGIGRSGLKSNLWHLFNFRQITSSPWVSTFSSVKCWTSQKVLNSNLASDTS